MAYTKQTWADGSGGGTPITAARLSYMEDGIGDAHDLIAAGVTSATAYRRVAIWNGTNYVVNAVTVTSSNRVATTFYSFLGGPDPNALGLMIDGDEWKDAT